MLFGSLGSWIGRKCFFLLVFCFKSWDVIFGECLWCLHIVLYSLQRLLGFHQHQKAAKAQDGEDEPFLPASCSSSLDYAAPGALEDWSFRWDQPGAPTLSTPEQLPLQASVTKSRKRRHQYAKYPSEVQWCFSNYDNLVISPLFAYSPETLSVKLEWSLVSLDNTVRNWRESRQLPGSGVSEDFSVMLLFKIMIYYY